MVIIDPGHGGFDPGGGSNKYFKEKDMNLRISLYEEKRLNDLGIKCKLTRTSDITLYPNDRINKVATLSKSFDDILISNHVNIGGGSGGEIIYSVKGSPALPNLISKYLKENGLPIRSVYQRKNSLGKDYYYILRDVRPSFGMIIEYGFADNETDTTRLLYSYPLLAEAVIHALCDYYGIKYTNNPFTYIVKPKDTLWKISKEQNTTVNKIMKDNGLNSDIIYPEQALLIYS